MGIFSDIGTSIGGIIGAGKAKKDSKKAMRAQVEAAKKGMGEINTQWGQTQDYFQPWMTAGTGALGGYSDLTGLNGNDAWQAAIQQLQQSPYYQSLYRTGEEALLQNASATGGLRGGNTQRGLADFGADTLSTAIQQQLQNLGPGMQMGYGATGALAGMGQQKASDIANLFLGQGQAQAADYLRRAGLTMGQWQNIGGLAGTVGDFASAGFGAPGGGFNFGAAFKGLGG